MRVIGKLMKILAWSAGTVLVLIVCFALTVLEWPSLLLNPTVLNWSANQFSKDLTGMYVYWNNLDTSSQSNSLWNKQVSIHVDRLCLETPFIMKHCFRSVDLGFAYDFKSILPKLTELGPVTALGGNSEVDLVNLKRLIQRSPSPHRVKANPPQWHLNVKFNPIQLEISKYLLKMANADVRGAANFRHQDELSILKIESQMMKEKGVELASAHGYFEAHDLAEHLFGPWNVSGFVKVDSKENGKAHLEVGLKPDERGRYRYQFDANFTSKIAMGTARSVGTLGSEKMEGTYSQDVQLQTKSPSVSTRGAPQASGSHIRVVNCNYRYFQTDQKQESGKFSLNCPISVDVPTIANAQYQTVSKAFKLKRTSVVNIKADLNSPYPLDLKRPISGSISVVPEKLFSKIVKTQGELQTQLAVVLADLPKFEKLESKFTFQAEIPEFSALVQALSKSSLAVPAPFQALRGPIRLGIDGKLNQKEGIISTKFRSQLSSPKKTQRIALKTDGTLKINLEKSKPSLFANLDVLLSDIRFAFPKLELTPLPQILRDHRLTGASISNLLKKGTRSVKVPLTYHIDVRTPPGQPVQLVSSLADTPVPIDINLNARSPGDLLGTLRIRHYPEKFLTGKREMKEIVVQLDTEMQKGIPMGEIHLKTFPSDTLTEIPPAQLAGQAAGQAASTRTGPKFSVPAVRVFSSLLLGVPLDEVSLEPNVASRPPTSKDEKEGVQFLQLRRRF